MKSRPRTWLTQTLFGGDGPKPATWLPLVLGVTIALLAIHSFYELLVVPAERAEFFLLLWLVEGYQAWFFASLNMLFLAWLAYACLNRQGAAVWGILGYGTYWIVAIWAWSSQFSDAPFTSQLLTNSLATVMILALGRFVLLQRAQFDH